MIKKPKVKITLVDTGWNCDCCGYIYDRNATLEVNGITILDFSYDAHF